MKQLSGTELAGMARSRSGATRVPGATGESGALAPLLLDVREIWEFELASIRLDGLQTLLMPMNSVPGRLAELSPEQPVVCICHHGARSAQVVAFLERQGFEAVYNLAGGIDAWSLQVDPAVPRY